MTSDLGRRAQIVLLILYFATLIGFALAMWALPARSHTAPSGWTYPHSCFGSPGGM